MRKLHLAAFVILPLLAAACGKTPDPQAKEEAGQKFRDAGKQMEQAAKDMDEAMKKGGAGMGDAMAKMGSALTGAVEGAAKSVATTVEPVDFRELKALLPETVGSMKRVSAEGEKSGAMGLVVAHAEARYEGDGGSMTVKITDPGNLSGFAAMAAMWMNVELDRETDRGYEKTGSTAGRRFHEKYDKGSKSGEYTMIVGKRFVVDVNGSGVDMPAMKKAMDQINLAKLESMKDSGVKQ